MYIIFLLLINYNLFRMCFFPQNISCGNQIRMCLFSILYLAETKSAWLFSILYLAETKSACLFSILYLAETKSACVVFSVVYFAETKSAYAFCLYYNLQKPNPRVFFSLHSILRKLNPHVLFFYIIGCGNQIRVPTKTKSACLVFLHYRLRKLNPRAYGNQIRMSCFSRL